MAAKKKKETVAELKQLITELTAAFQRERADSLNLRRRLEEERAQLGDFYKAVVVRELLPLIDNCERLLEHISAHSKEVPWKEGAEKIVQQSQKTLADFGVERIKTVGQHFDPHFHEAVHMDLPSDLSTEASAKEGASAKGGEGNDHHEIVSQELRAGYKLGDEVLRPALVKVKKQKK